MRTRLLFILLLAGALTAGCASKLPRLAEVTAGEKQRLLSGALLFPDTYHDLVMPEEDVFALTAEMRAFVEQAVAGVRTEDRKIEAVLRAIVDAGKLGVVYDDNASYTASSVFRQRRANCLSFTTLVVPMLRHVGIRAEFNDVDVPPIWDLQNTDILVLYRHINAIVTHANGSREVIDFNLGEYDSEYPQDIIPDRVAAAQYYNNRAVEFLLQQETVAAFRYLSKAIDMAPEVSFFWVNLGALYRQNGHLQAAETAYRAALEADPVDLVAISGAERVYSELGQDGLAREFRQRAEYYRQINPYYHYTLAMSFYVRKEYVAALDEIRTAIRRFPEEHRFFFLQGAIYQSLGDKVKSGESMQMALQLADSRKQQERYRRKMELLR